MQQGYLKLEMEKLPDSGIYLLLINNEGNRSMIIGSLGDVFFREGYYIYVGSAQRNLRKRIERHLRKEKRIKWHIDYFLQYAKVVDIYALKKSKEYEEKIAFKLSEHYPFINNFGSSDSRAQSHLFYIKNRDEWNRVKEIINNSTV